MTCYVAHLNKKGFFEPLRIRITKENAREIEHEIARTVGLEGKLCPEIWMETKKWLEDPEKKAVIERNLERRFASKSSR